MVVGWQICDGWWVIVEMCYDFSVDCVQKVELGLEYCNECVIVEMVVKCCFSDSDNLCVDISFDLGIWLGGFGWQ